MSKFSALSILSNAVRGRVYGHSTWTPQWSTREPRDHYDVIIIGAGGHGMGAAYYLARKHGINKVLVIDKGWLGGGNTARNTTIIRSNYLFSESSRLYDHSLDLWHGLSKELNYNVMFSDRGVLMLAHSVHEQQVLQRIICANRLNRVDNEWLSRDDISSKFPKLSLDEKARYPLLGGAWQARGGVARHDAVAWGYARAASRLGVDIVENCAVSSISVGENGKVRGVETERGFIGADRIGVSAAGNTSPIMQSAGIKVPLESFPLQALVSEPVKPVLPFVVMGTSVHAYLSQSSKGELVIGASSDQYLSYSQRGNWSVIEDFLAAVCEMFPQFSRMKLLRMWGGVVDITADRSPIIGMTPLDGLYLNCGWGTGGFKATPGAADLFAHTIAHDAPHEINAPFTLDRFRTGRLIDEAAAAAVAH